MEIFPTLDKDHQKTLPDIKVVCDTDSVWSRFICSFLLQKEEEKE